MKALERIGFNFEGQCEQWMKQYNKMLDYREKHGNCYQPDLQLIVWVHRQRYFYHLYKGHRSVHQLTEEENKLLDDAGFDWGKTMITSKGGNFSNGSESEIWMKHYQKLLEFHSKHGNCRVGGGRDGRKRDNTLRDWVSSQ
mmetsp:Transcript_14030/g.20740  ORF Transcript_14030/g.20740 Transcript_14030/m.20740 type:complete len:141 (-) Transcript_14030:233-655(-)